MDNSAAANSTPLIALVQKRFAIPCPAEQRMIGLRVARRDAQRRGGFRATVECNSARDECDGRFSKPGHLHAFDESEALTLHTASCGECRFSSVRAADHERGRIRDRT
ncbi:MAG: hypothetical protein WCB85_02945 [Candidatus Dormiibacterota bacterium]